uniref:Alpha-1B adrenergic receptor n=1 Tax=Equus asinus asinus TaxID=83772 RepID=A0A8C4KSD6_EQUAS
KMLVNDNTSSNSTLPQLDITRAVSVGLVLGAFILFAIVGNILVILSVACNRHLRTPTNYLIVNLAIADLLLSFTVLPFSAALEVLGYWVLGRIFCDIWAAVDVLCCTASILSLCAISIDRYIGVRYSLQYPTLVTRRKAILALLSVWVLSTVISIGPLLGWKEPAPNDDKECGVTEEPFYALFSSLGSFYIPLAVILVMYCRVYIVAKRTTKNLEAGVMKEMSNSKELTLRIHSKNFHEDTLSSAKAKGHNPRSSIAVKLFKFSREKKAAKTLGIVVGMFILCWLPFFIALPLGSLFSTLKAPDAVFKVVFWLGYFNSCLNPIIYPCSSKEFKRAFVRILGCQCRGRRRRRRRRRLGGCATQAAQGGHGSLLPLPRRKVGQAVAHIPRKCWVPDLPPARACIMLTCQVTSLCSCPGRVQSSSRALGANRSSLLSPSNWQQSSPTSSSLATQTLLAHLSPGDMHRETSANQSHEASGLPRWS